MKNLKPGIVFLFVIFAFIFACQKEVHEPFALEISNQLDYMPADINILAYSSIEKLKASDIFSLLVDSLKENPFQDREYREFMDSTNLDLQRDISEIYVAGKFGKKMDSEGLMLVFGQFDRVKITNYLMKKDESRELILEKYLNFELYHLKPVGHDSNKVFCFVDEKCFIAGSEKYVKGWIDKKQSPTPPEKVKSTLMAQIEKLKYKNQGWVVVTAESIIENLDLSPEMKEKYGIQSMKYLNFSLQLSDKIEMNGELECTDAEKAGLFLDIVKGAISTAKLTMSNDRDAVDALNKIDVSSQDNRVILDGQLTKEDIQKIMHQKGVLM